MENQRDEKLWHMAQQRVKFKGHLVSYILVNAFLWGIWLFTRDHSDHTGIPWPAWVSLGWGFGLAMRYFRTFHTNSGDEVEKEYQKLVDSQKK